VCSGGHGDCLVHIDSTKVRREGGSERERERGGERGREG